MKQRILMIAPKYVSRAGEYYEFPLGIACVTAVLRKAGYEVECLNLNHHDTPVEQIVRDRIIKKEIDVVCAGGFSTHYRNLQAIFQAAESARPGVRKIAGGSLVTSEPEIVAEGLRLDAGIVGEGEITILELLDALSNSQDLGKVKGIVYKNNKGIYKSTPGRPLIEDLGALPLPDYDGFDIEAYLDLQRPDDRQYLYIREKPRFMYSVASRACPYKCSFCFPMFGRKIRKRPLDHFFAEVDMLVDKYGVNVLGVFDALFDTSREYLKDFCARIKKYELKWMMQIRVGNIDEERAALLKDSGLFAIQYGLESASDEILKKMKKSTTTKSIEEALALNRQMRIRIFGEFIFGHPDETWDTAMETLKWWYTHSFYQIDMGHLYPFPGCDDYHKAIEKGVITDRLKYLEEGCRSVNLTDIDDEKYAELFKAISACGRKYAYFGEVVSIKKERFDKTKNALAFTIKVMCPHCGEKSSLRHYHIENLRKTIKYPYSPIAVTCLHCNQGFSLKEQEIAVKCPDIDVKKKFWKGREKG